MGYDRSHAIVVSSWNDEDLATARAFAVAAGLDDLTTPIIRRRINGGGSFAILPDGSQEGWDDSEDADRQRAEFIRLMRAQLVYADGGVKVSWVEVQFDDDELETKVCDDSDRTLREKRYG